MFSLGKILCERSCLNFTSRGGGGGAEWVIFKGGADGRVGSNGRGGGGGQCKVER